MPDICERYRPAAVQAGVVLSTSGSGPIEVIAGKTGVTRSCDNYDAVKLKCRQWTGEAPIKLHHKKVAALTPTRSLEQAKAAKAKANPPSNAPAAKAIETALTPPKSVAPKATEAPAAPAAESTTRRIENA